MKIVKYLFLRPIVNKVVMDIYVWLSTVSQHLERRRMVPTSERMRNAVAKLNDLLNFDKFDLPYKRG